MVFDRFNVQTDGINNMLNNSMLYISENIKNEYD